MPQTMRRSQPNKRKRDLGSDRESPSIKSEEDELETPLATPRRSLRRSGPTAPPAASGPSKRVRLDLDNLISFDDVDFDVDLDNEPVSQPVTPKQRQSKKIEPPPRIQSFPPTKLPAACSGDLHSQPLRIPGREAELPPIFVCKWPHPQNPRPDNRCGVDYVMVLDLSDQEAMVDILMYGLRCAIPRDGDQETAHHAQSDVTFDHDGGLLILKKEDYAFLRHLRSNGNPLEDVCITFGYGIEELSADMMTRIVDLRNELIGAEGQAGSKAPTTHFGGEYSRIGGTALEREPRSNPVEGTTRAINVGVSVEPQKGGLHAPGAGSWYDHSKPLADQDSGFKLRRKFNMLSTEQATEGLFKFAPVGLAALLEEHAELMNVPRIGYGKNPGFTNQQSNQAAPENRDERQRASAKGKEKATEKRKGKERASAKGKEKATENGKGKERASAKGKGKATENGKGKERADPESDEEEEEASADVDAYWIKTLGGFGMRHGDVRDLLAGLSNLLSLSKIPHSFHPGVMILLCLGIARRLDAFTSFFMCGLHVHAGTVPTFSDEMKDLMKPECTRLLNILYMSSAVMGGEGPIALAPLAPGSLLQVSREYQDPTRDPRAAVSMQGHNSYARDGISLMHAPDQAKYIGRNLLTIAVNTLNAFPDFMRATVDRDAFLKCFHFTDENGVRFQLEDWALGPGHGPGGEEHERPAGVEEISPPPLYNNYLRAGAIGRWAEHTERHRLSVPVANLVETTAQGGEPLNKPVEYARIIADGLKGIRPFSAEGEYFISANELDVFLILFFISPAGPSTVRRKSAAPYTAAAAGTRKKSKKTGAFAAGMDTTALKGLSVLKTARAAAPFPSQQNATAGPSGGGTATRSSERAAAMESADINGPDPAAPLHPQQNATAGPSRAGPATRSSKRAATESAGEQGADKRPRVEDPNSDGEPEVDSAERELEAAKPVREKAAQKLLECFSLELLELELERTRDCAEVALQAKTLEIDRGAHIEKINVAVNEVMSTSADPLAKLDPLGEASPQAIADILASSAKLSDNVNIGVLVTGLERQRVLSARCIAHIWLQDFVVPRLEDLADDLLSKETQLLDSSGHWLQRLIWTVNWNLAEGTSLDAQQFLIGFKTRNVLVPKQAFTSHNRREVLIEATTDVLRSWLHPPGKESSAKARKRDTGPQIIGRFISRVYDLAGPAALHLPGVWDVQLNPGRKLVGATGRKKFISPEELNELEVALEGHPICDPESAERKALEEIGNVYASLLTHVKLPPPAAARPVPIPKPANLLAFVRVALRTISARGAAAAEPTNKDGLSELELAIIGHMLSNTDHLHPVRRSAEGYRPLIAAGGPLHADHLRTIAGLYSMGLWRGTTYHTLFAKSHVLFTSSKPFLAAVKNLALKDFVIDNCYAGQTQMLRSKRYKENAEVLDNTVNSEAVNWFLKEGASSPKNAKNKTTSEAVPSNKPSYMELFEIFNSTKLPFPMCGNLVSHLLAADYADAGVCTPPSKHEMGRIICRIDAGAVAGMRALDYYYEAKPLQFRIQRSFSDLYDYLDGQLTADEKDLANWGPIFLEHTLCKYGRFITDTRFYRFFEPTYFTKTVFNHE